MHLCIYDSCTYSNSCQHTLIPYNCPPSTRPLFSHFLISHSDDDAFIINDSWKYKDISAGSLQMVKDMIASKLCIGIYRLPQTHTQTQESQEGQEEGLACHKRKRPGCGEKDMEVDGEGQEGHMGQVGHMGRGEGELVSWCMIYDYGALGMLHTIPGHRGRGLAKAAVQALLLLIRESPTDMRCPPFCYIERSNDASRAVFTKLGFLRIDDALWAGMRYKDA
jgi:RimJ/RimL family protein N-acetyltransferase